MQTAEALAVVIRGLRRGKSFSQEDINSIGRSHLSRIERGEVNITLDVLSRLAAILEVDAAVLLLMANAVQAPEPLEDSLKRLSKQLRQIRKEGIHLEIQSLVQAGKPRPGRPARSDALQKALEARRLQESGASVTQIAQSTGLSVATIRRYLRASTTVDG